MAYQFLYECGCIMPGARGEYIFFIPSNTRHTAKKAVQFGACIRNGDVWLTETSEDGTEVSAFNDQAFFENGGSVRKLMPEGTLMTTSEMYKVAKRDIRHLFGWLDNNESVSFDVRSFSEL